MRPFFQWADTTAISEMIRDSRFLFPIIETVHLLALTVLFGSIIVLNLRLMGVGLRGQSIAAVRSALKPLTFWSLLTMLGSGWLLFLSEAMKCYENPPFFFKMSMLFFAIIFQWTAIRSLAQRGEPANRVVAGGAAVVSLVLWFGVGVGGRAIGFY